MIVKLKKATIATLAEYEHQTLMGLRDLGVLHVAPVRSSPSQDAEALKGEIDRLETAFNALSSLKAKAGPKGNLEPSEVARRVIDLVEQRAASQDRLKNLLNEIEKIKPLGRFSRADWDLLRANGIFARVYRATKEELEKTPIHRPHAILSDTRTTRCVLAVSKKDFALPFEEIHPPERGLPALWREAESLEHSIEDMNRELVELSSYVPSLTESIVCARERLEFAEVLSGMGRSETVSYLQAYCPVDEMERLEGFSREAGCGLLFEDPDEKDAVPTLVRNPRWLRMIEPVFKLMGTVPGYREYDVSLWFLVSLGVFFAMLISDGGYGVLFLFATLVARLFMKSAPAEPFRLLTLLSLAAVVWGIMAGTWFGVEHLARLPLLRGLVIPDLYAYSDNQHLMIKLCFLLGGVHLTIAHAIRFLRFVNSLRALAEIGWIILLWFLYFLACHLVLGEPLPGFALYFFISGLFLASAFSNPQTHFIRSFLLAFADLPLNVIRSFSDVVSYLRLFAVGYATLVVAMSFNQMASRLGWADMISGVGAVLILLIGHSLNIVLGGMAVLVHGVRLNMLEFSSHLEISWSGHEFRPFRRQNTAHRRNEL